MNILLFGPPGSGKGTQSALLVQGMGYKHISTGDLFRENMKNDTELGKEAKGYMNEGKLVPDSLTIAMVKDALSRLAGKSFILDGFPRNIPQAEALDGLLGHLNLNLDKAVFLEVPSDKIVARLSGRRLCKNCGAVYHIEHHMPMQKGVCESCGKGPIYQRDDDKDEAIQTRLKVYAESTAPLKDLYQSKGKLSVIDGDDEEAVVYKRIKSQLEA